MCWPMISVLIMGGSVYPDTSNAGCLKKIPLGRIRFRVPYSTHCNVRMRSGQIP